jgi:hypothetical protein
VTAKGFVQARTGSKFLAVTYRITLGFFMAGWSDATGIPSASRSKMIRTGCFDYR